MDAILTTEAQAHAETVAGVRAAVAAAGLYLTPADHRGISILFDREARQLGEILPLGDGRWEARRGAAHYPYETREDACGAALRGVLGW